jgi:mannose-1-phosphate guanylyltransferase
MEERNSRIDSHSMMISSPVSRPLPISRHGSYRNLEGQYVGGSPDRTTIALPPHIASLSSANPQPAPLLAKKPDLGLWCVVPAGGAGTRLWPLSRESYPKFLLDLTGSGRTLIQSTWDRLLPLAGSSQLMVVTGAAHVDPVMGQLPDLEEANVFAEPSPKESMAAIGLAAAVLKRRDPDAVLGSFAADHIISGRDAFESAVTEAVAVAKAGYLVTIGIAPSHPSTGFGYIKLGESLQQKDAPNARKVTEFKEKPDARTASAYLSTGNYRWNGGMFVVKAAVLMDLLKGTVPALHAGLEKIADAWDTPARQSVLHEIWPTLDKIAIDHAVAEPAARSGKVAVVPATFGWDDVGDFSSLADLLPAEKGEARVLGDPNMVITEGQAGGLVIPAGGRPIACLGVDDVVVVDTQHVLLVTTRARAQDVKKMVARVKARKWTHLT